MTIIHKSLGNNPKVIQKAFRQHFADGLSGLRYDAYCYGWKDGWQEGKQVAEAKNKELLNRLGEILNEDFAGTTRLSSYQRRKAKELLGEHR
jgi:hypothetical protein